MSSYIHSNHLLAYRYLRNTRERAQQYMATIAVSKCTAQTSNESDPPQFAQGDLVKALDNK